MNIPVIVFVIIGVYLSAILLWWVICAIASKNAIRSKNRGHFDFVEMLDIGLMRLWRFVSYCALTGLIIWLVMIGRWYLAILPLLWYVKVWWFGSIFYWPFNLVESHYSAKVELFYGFKHYVSQSKDKGKQIEEMKKRGWTIPDKMK